MYMYLQMKYLEIWNKHCKLMNMFVCVCACGQSGKWTCGEKVDLCVPIPVLMCVHVYLFGGLLCKCVHRHSINAHSVIEELFSKMR